MSKDWQSDVTDFHRKFGIVIHDKPTIPKDGPSGGMMGTAELRKKLILEECLELVEAIDAENLPEVADGIVDLIVVTLGTAITYGINVQPVWDLIHDSNMAKEGGGKRADGKILKPPHWKHPDIAAEMGRQGL